MSSVNRLSVAVVGAGIAGLRCAALLRAAGHTVTVFEKGANVGGRVATRRTEIGGFDHGSQYFTVQGDAFAAALKQWRAAGVADEWVARVVALEAGGMKSLSGVTQRYVGVPGMNAIATHMAQGLDVRLEQQVIDLQAVSQGGRRSWALSCMTAAAGPGGIAVTEGLYDAVVLALPADSALPLLGALPSLAAVAEGVQLEPCWTLMLGYDQPLDLPYDAAFVDGARLNWIARETSKPGRRLGERWVGQADAAWSIEHLEDDPEDVKQKMLKAFHEATGNRQQPIYSVVHRWRFALCAAGLPEDCVWDAAARLGLCGDWCGGPRIEGAWVSGAALAARILAQGM